MEFKLFDLKYSSDTVLITVHDSQYLPSILQFFTILVFRFSNNQNVHIKTINNHSFSVVFSKHSEFNEFADLLDYFQFLR